MKMPCSSQAEADSPIFFYEYQKSLFEEIRESISGLTNEDIESIAAPPLGMSHVGLYLLECCLFRFGITTVADASSRDYGDSNSPRTPDSF